MYKVYIADDSILVRKELVLTTPWESLNCNVVGQAGNGHAALEEILKLEPDIVITDIRMPKMDGLELIKELKAKGSNAEFVVISGYSEFEYALSAIKLEVNDYILKPISDTELIQTIEKIISRIEERKNTEIINHKLRDTLLIEDIKANMLEDYADKNLSIHLRNAIEHIQSYYMEDLSIKDVTKELSISESYLTKLFKQEINITFIEYLTQVRIRKAIELMKENKLPIYRIAEEVGYKDYRYFSLVFKKMIGISPKKYQNKIIK
ncbi:response regulator [Proteiniborus sp.]|uniref:response regulator transcription factor n=1 Tax=Proteiniborus sp. TaxID=2079015 RepID=UPI00331EF693